MALSFLPYALLRRCRMEEVQGYNPALHVFVCINERESMAPMHSCSPTIKREDVKEIKNWIRSNGWTGVVQCTSCLCLGQCNKDGGVLKIYPTQRMVKGLRTVEEIKTIILEEKEKVLPN